MAIALLELVYCVRQDVPWARQVLIVHGLRKGALYAESHHLRWPKCLELGVYSVKSL